MTGPSDSTIKRLFALSRNKCAYPNCTIPIVDPNGAVLGDVCHIQARSPGGPRFDASLGEGEVHGFSNLILMCALHHRLIDSDQRKYCAELLVEMKELHERNGDIELSVDSSKLVSKLIAATNIAINAGDSAQVMIGSPGAIQTQNFTFKSTKKKAPSVIPTSGAIGHNLAKRNYVWHLIERYQDFQKWDESKTGTGKYVTIFNALKREFGSKWDFIPEAQFDRLVSYLQMRILKTKLGRIRNSRNEPCFSDWEEWVARNT